MKTHSTTTILIHCFSLYIYSAKLQKTGAKTINLDKYSSQTDEEHRIMPTQFGRVS